MNQRKANRIYGINGPVITLLGNTGFSMMEMVYVGEAGLIGEVIRVNSAATTIQVYENTTGLRVGEPVKGTGAPLSATLGPGVMQNIFDGIERPLGVIAQREGAFIGAGVHVDSLDGEKQWDVTPVSYTHLDSSKLCIIVNICSKYY